MGNHYASRAPRYRKHSLPGAHENSVQFLASAAFDDEWTLHLFISLNEQDDVFHTFVACLGADRLLPSMAELVRGIFSDSRGPLERSLASLFALDFSPGTTATHKIVRPQTVYAPHWRLLVG
jgi:hypothetical protein